jgi:hypothetical protein
MCCLLHVPKNRPDAFGAQPRCPGAADAGCAAEPVLSAAYGSPDPDPNFRRGFSARHRTGD